MKGTAASIQKLIANLPSRTEDELREMKRNAIRQGGEAAEALLMALASIEERRRNGPLEPAILHAFRKTTDVEKRLIAILSNNPGQTSQQLSKLMGYKDGNGWHLQFGRMCRERESLLPPPVAPERKGPDGDDAYFYSGIIADFDYDARTFQLKPAALSAFIALGIVSLNSQRNH